MVPNIHPLPSVHPIIQCFPEKRNNGPSLWIKVIATCLSSCTTARNTCTGSYPEPKLNTHVPTTLDVPQSWNLKGSRKNGKKESNPLALGQGRRSRDFWLHSHLYTDSSEDVSLPRLPTLQTLHASHLQPRYSRALRTNPSQESPWPFP